MKKFLKIEEAKEFAHKVINNLNALNTDDIMDDGCDSCDAEQNHRFTMATDIIDDLQDQLAVIEIDGVSSQTLDREWKKAWGNGGRYSYSHLPESKIEHAIEYANWILTL